MHKNTVVKHMDSGEKGVVPIEGDGRSGFDRKAVENCLVVFPAPEDKTGIVISDAYLKTIGYHYLRKSE